MAEKQIDLNYVPRDWQRECHGDGARFRVLALHRRSGKTVLATMELLDRALSFKKELGLFVYVAPFLAQAKNIAWGMLKHRIKPILEMNGATVNEAELTITFLHNGAKLKLFGADNPNGMRGVRIDGAVIDEVAQMKPMLWQDVVQPALSDRNGWAIFIGTPMGVNLFSELYFKGKNSPGWSSKVYTVYQTNALEAEEVARLKEDMSPTSFAREMMCSFEAAGDDQLMSLEEIELACLKVYKPGENDYAPRIMGVDPAGGGADSSVIVKRQGLQIYDPIAFNGIDNMALADQVAYHISTWQPEAVFIDHGMGDGVISRLRQMNHSVIGVWFGSTKTNNPRYANKRAEMYFNLKEWISEGGAIPNHARLKQDLATPVYWPNTAGKLILEPKEGIKGRGLPSPDYADAAVLTFANPVVKKAREPVAAPRVEAYDVFDRERLRNPGGKTGGFDPFSRGKR